MLTLFFKDCQHLTLFFFVPLCLKKKIKSANSDNQLKSTNSISKIRTALGGIDADGGFAP